MAGGTGFYIDALCDRIELPNVAPNPALRKKLADKSATQLFAMLKKKDPKRARTMNTPSERNNAVRLIRALEIAASPRSEKDRPLHAKDGPFQALWVGISPSATVLEQRIKLRLVARMKAGMVAEARKLKREGLSYKRMRELGLEYRSLADLLEKKITKAQFVEILYSEIRRYARKQTGYWNRNSDIEWFDPKQVADIEASIRGWLTNSRHS